MKNRHKAIPWMYSMPALLLIAAVIVFPIIYTGYISLTNMNLYHWNNFEFIGLDNYARALLKADSGFLQALFVTILWTGFNMGIQVVAAYFIALGLNCEGLRGKRVYKTLLMFPWAMLAYVSILLWRVGIYNTEFGLLNKIRVALGLEKANYLSTNTAAFISCMVLNLWMALPFMIMMILGHFLEDKNVPDVMYMIPGTIEEYLYTRLKFAIKLQMGILIVIELVRSYILIVKEPQGELVEELFMVVATVLYSIINSVYTFYRTYTYKPLYKETWGMAALVPYCIIVCLRPEYGDNVPVILLIRVLFVVLFAGWAYYICRFVKKNILLTTYYGGENT